MSRLTNYIKEVSAQARQRGSSLYHSRLLRFGFLATLASAFVMPMLLPVMASLFLVAPLLYHGAMSVARPLMADFSLRDVRRSLSSVFNGGSDRATVVPLRGDDSQGRSEEKVRKGQYSPSTLSGEASVPRGRKTGEPMVDFLIKRLRDSGMTVTTDWKRSRKFLDTLPDKYDSLKHNQRKMCGFVYEGIIHINPSKKALETPLHEYTHIWAEVLRQKNPDEWKNIVGLMKQETRLWDSVCKSYPHLETDDEIADEVLATYSGKRGAALLRQHYQQGDTPGKALNGVMEALKAFWNGVCGFFKVDFSDKDEIADTILSDFLHGVKLMDDLDKNRQTLNDRMPLSQLDGNTISDYVMEKELNTRHGFMKQEEYDVQMNGDEHFNDTIILSLDSFPASKEPGFSPVADLPPYVRFDENGEYKIEMEFHDGYARDLNPHSLGTYDRTALYYPTVKEIEGDNDRQSAISCYTGRVWSEGSYQDKIYDIALKYGQASRLHCPTERYDDAVKAVVERTVDSSARAFTPEQLESIQLAAACNGEDLYSGSFRDTFYERLHSDALAQMKGVNPHWINDTLNELMELSHGKVRDEGMSLHR